MAVALMLPTCPTSLTDQLADLVLLLPPPALLSLPRLPQPAAAEANRVQKKKLWEGVQPDLKTSADRVAGYKGAAMMTTAGPITAKSLAAANIS